MDVSFFIARYLKKQFKNADKNGNGTLSFSEVQGLMTQLNIQMDKERIKELFKVPRSRPRFPIAIQNLPFFHHPFQAANTKMEPGKSGIKESLDESEFIAFYNSLLKRPEFEQIFHKYVSHNDNGRMTAEDLRRFMREEQEQEWTLEQCQAVIKTYETVPGQNAWSSEGKEIRGKQICGFLWGNARSIHWLVIAYKKLGWEELAQQPLLYLFHTSLYTYSLYEIQFNGWLPFLLLFFNYYFENGQVFCFVHRV